MPQYFLCYRRDDTAGHAGRLYGDLVRELDEESVFFDLRSVPAGEDFREVVRNSIAACEVVLVLIGRNWQPQLLHEPADYVRHEIEAALAGGKRVVPVLVQGTAMPEPEALPEEIRQLAYRNASEISDRHWDADVKALVRVLRPRRSRMPMLWGVAAGIVALVLTVLAVKPAKKPERGGTSTAPATAADSATTTTPPSTTVTTAPPTTTRRPIGTTTLLDRPQIHKGPSSTSTRPTAPSCPTKVAGGVMAVTRIAEESRIGLRVNRAAGVTYSGMLVRESGLVGLRRQPLSADQLEAGVSQKAIGSADYELQITITGVDKPTALLEVTVTLGGRDSCYTLAPSKVPATYQWRGAMR